MRFVVILFVMVMANMAVAQMTFGPEDDDSGNSSDNIYMSSPDPAPQPAPMVPQVIQPSAPAAVEQMPAPAPVPLPAAPPAPTYPQCSANRMTNSARLASQMMESVLHVRNGTSSVFRNPIDSDKDFELLSSRGELMATVRGYSLPASICQRDANRLFVKIDASSYGYGAFYVTAQAIDSRRVRIVPSKSSGAVDYSDPDKKPAIYHVSGASR